MALSQISLLLVSGRSWLWNANKRPPSFSVPVPSHSLSLCTQKGSIADPMVWPKLYLSGEAMILSALNVIYSKRLPKSTQRDRLHSDLCFLASLYLTPGPTTHTHTRSRTHIRHNSTVQLSHARTHMQAQASPYVTFTTGDILYPVVLDLIHGLSLLGALWTQNYAVIIENVNRNVASQPAYGPCGTM